MFFTFLFSYLFFLSLVLLLAWGLRSGMMREHCEKDLKFSKLESFLAHFPVHIMVHTTCAFWYFSGSWPFQKARCMLCSVRLAGTRFG